MPACPPVPSLRRAAGAALALALAAGAGRASAQDLFLRGGHLVDPRSRTVATGNLLILDGRIAGRPAAPPEGFAGTVLDLDGAWVLPGLRDLHVHSMVNVGPRGETEVLGTGAAAVRMLYAGVVGFLDLFNLEDYIFELRDAQRAGEGGEAADIYAAGPCLTATDGHCTEYPIPTRIIDTPQDARREVTALAGRHPDVVKLVYEHLTPEEEAKTWRKPRPSIDRPTLAAAIATARHLGLRTVVHIRSWEDVRDAAEAGATAVTHLPADRPAPPEVVAALVEHGTTLLPTLTTGDTDLVTRPGLLDAPLLTAVAGADLLDAYRALAAHPEKTERTVAGFEQARRIHRESLARLVAAGVPVLAGTDAGNPWTFQGFSLHRELELLVDEGLDPWAALAAATTAAGDFLGQGWGLDPGDDGSLLVLAASPLEDIANTRRIRRVIHHGRVVDRDDLLAHQPPPPSLSRPGGRPRDGGPDDPPAAAGEGRPAG